MSLHTVLTLDPLIDVVKEQRRVIQKGGINKSIFAYNADTSSDANIAWNNIAPPSLTTITKREFIVNYNLIAYVSTPTSAAGGAPVLTTPGGGTAQPLLTPSLNFDAILGAPIATPGAAITTVGVAGQPVLNGTQVAGSIPVSNNNAVSTSTFYDPANPNFGFTGCLRSFPLAEVSSATNLFINGQNLGVQSNDVAAIYPYLLNEDEREYWSTAFPCQPDTYPYLLPLYLAQKSLQSTRDPIVPFNGGTDHMSRSSIRATLWRTCTNASPGVRYDSYLWNLYEPLMISPLTFGDAAFDEGFANINLITIKITMTDLARALTVSPVAVNNPAVNSTIVSVTMQPSNPPAGFTQTTASGGPVLYLQYVTNAAILETKQPEVLFYPYEQLTSYPQSAILPDISAVVSATPPTYTAAEADKEFALQSLRLSSIPSKIWVFGRPSRTSYSGNNALTAMLPNQFARITGVKITFDNRSVLLATATEYDLWQMSVRNGVKMSFAEWKTNGSILCIDFTKDVCLPDTDVVGQSNKFSTLQVTLRATTQNIITAQQMLHPYWYPLSTANDATQQTTIGTGAGMSSYKMDAYIVTSLVGEAMASKSSFDIMLVGPSSKEVIEMTEDEDRHRDEGLVANMAAGGDMTSTGGIPRLITSGLDKLSRVTPAQVDSTLKAISAVNDAVKSFTGPAAATSGGASVGAGARRRIY